MQTRSKECHLSCRLPGAVVNISAFHHILADAILRPPEPPAPSLLRSLEASEVTDLCEICGFDTEPDNLIVYCESCNMGVHQTCYGISEVRCETEWACRV